MDRWTMSLGGRSFQCLSQFLNPEHLRFEKDMLFISPKQFNDTIIEYAVCGGWGGGG